MSDEGEELHLRDYLRTVRRYRGTAASVACAAAMGALVVAVLLPQSWHSTVTLALLPSDPEVQVEARARSVSRPDDILETQIEILQSGPVFLEVAERLDLEEVELVARSPLSRALVDLRRRIRGIPPAEPTASSRANQLRSLVSVRRGEDARVLRITVSTRDSRLSQRIASTLVEVFAERTLDFKRKKSSSDRTYLAGKLATTREDLVGAENELREFEEVHDAIALERRIESLSDLRIQTETVLADVRRQIEEVTAQANARLRQLSSVRRGVVESAVERYSDAQQSLFDLRLKRADLKKSYTAEHPDVREIDERIQALEAMVAETEKALLKGRTGSVSGLERSLSEYNELVEKIEGLRAREGSLVATAEHYETRLKSDLELRSRYSFVRRDLDALQRIYDLLLIRQKEAALEADMQIPDVHVIEPPGPGSPDTSRVLRFGVVGVLGGLFLGVLAALFRGYMDQTVFDPEVLERRLGIPCLARIPRVSEYEAQRPVVDLRGVGPLIEPVAALTLSSALGTPEDPAQVYLVTSGGPEEGKTTLASHIALGFALGGERTILLDGDLRRPAVEECYPATANSLTLRELFREVPESLPHVSGIPELTVIRAHVDEDEAGSVARLFAGVGWARLLAALRERFDRVVIDSAPVNVVPDALHLAPLADRTLLVVRSGKARLPGVEKALRALREVRGRPVGFVMNALGGPEEEQYGYGYGYGYGYTDRSD